jgi:ATP-binding cassette subfamily F protein uup
LAEALVLEPDLLFLDEPTNHLDLEGIYWLEELLAQAPFAWVMISHDRMFLERTATRFLEINRMYPRGMFECVGRYSQFVERRAETLKAQESEAAALANKVRREVEWLRRGPQARATKAKGRIDEAHALIDELGRVKERVGIAAKDGASIDFSATTRKTRRLIVAEDLGIRVGDRTLLSKVDLVLTPGLRLGLMGGNGSGKTSLLKVLSGMEPPATGSLTQAHQLKIVYFDQNRERLDGSMTLRRTLCPSGDAVIFRGQSIHVAGWARRFAFSSAQLDVPVGELSGGEQARALIARLMLEDADVLLLDEPTNDLDLETLEALEDALRDFPGALVLVSHDRYLVDAVCNVIAALDGQGGLQLFADLSQWEAEARRKRSAATVLSTPPTQSAKGASETSSPPSERTGKGTKRLSYMEQREFDRIEGDIAEAEAKVAELEAAIQDPVMGADASKLAEAYGELTEAQGKVERLYSRWAELEAKLS